MKKALILLMFAILFACNSKQDDLSFYIKSRDVEDNRPIKVFLNDQPIIEMDLADNGIEENYNIFRTKADQSHERKVRVELHRFENDLAKEIKIPSKGSYDIIIIINSTQLYRDYNNLEIQDHLKYRATSNFRGFADSLYDNGIIEEKFMQIHKDSVIQISLLKK